MTLFELWAEAVRRHALRPALGWVDETAWTYTELDQRIRALQEHFAKLGLTAGDRLALWSHNHPAWGAVYLAVTTSGAVIVPLLPEFPAADTAQAFLHSGAKVLVVSKALREAWVDYLLQAPDELKTAIQEVTVLVLEELAEATSLAPLAVQEGPPLTENTLAAIIYTSGTTGKPKGVMLSHGNLASNVKAAAPIPRLQPGHRLLSVLPLAHTYECTLGLLIPLSLGCQVSYLRKPPAPAVLLPALASVRPHAMLTVPLFIEKIYRQKILPSLQKQPVKVLLKVPLLHSLILRSAGHKLKSLTGGRLHFFGIGGAGLAPEVARFLHQSGFPYAIGYGLTESSPLLAGHLGVKLFSTGKVLAGVRIKIAEPLNEEGAGEILAQGPNIMLGYYKDPERTAEVLSADGWLRTGDLGRFDRHGHLHIVGRSKNMILGPGGENIYPEPIEALFNQDQLIVETLVLHNGSHLVAKVVVDHETLPDKLAPWGRDLGKALEAYLENMKHLINKRLARFSHISHVEVQDKPFEKTATMKIKRYLYEKSKGKGRKGQ